MITGESRAGRQASRRPRGRRHGVDGLVDPGTRRRGRRRHRAGRHPAPRRRRPGQPEPRPGTRRPLRRAAVLRRHRGGRRSRSSPGAAVGDLDDAVTRTVTVLVIACPHALGLAIPLVIAIVDRGLGAGRDPRQGPARPGTDALDRHRPVRQDRHPDQGRATSSPASPRLPDSSDDRVLRLAGGRRGRQRTPAGPGDRRRGRRTAAGDPCDRISARSPAGASRPTSTGRATRSAAQRCSANADSTIPAELAATSSTDGPVAGAAVLYLAPRRATSSEPSRSRTRSDPRPAKPSPSSSDSDVERGDDHRRRPAGRRGGRLATSGSTDGVRRGAPGGQGPSRLRPPASRRDRRDGRRRRQRCARARPRRRRPGDRCRNRCRDRVGRGRAGLAAIRAASPA